MGLSSGTSARTSVHEGLEVGTFLAWGDLGWEGAGEDVEGGEQVNDSMALAGDFQAPDDWAALVRTSPVGRSKA
jgi:hypothetical protein